MWWGRVATQLKQAVFCPGGKQLASGSFDQSVILWDVGRGKEQQSLTGKKGFSGGAFSPDGTILAAGSVDGTVTLWDLPRWKSHYLGPR
jgi:WD40 repeat protein